MITASSQAKNNNNRLDNLSLRSKTRQQSQKPITLTYLLYHNVVKKDCYLNQMDEEVFLNNCRQIQLSNLIAQIQLGIQNGYDDNIDFLSIDTNLLTNIREYLLTVNLAQKLHAWIIEKKYFYFLSVRLECNALLFKKAAITSYKIEATDIFNMEIISAGPKSIKRKGFIDLALFADGPNGFTTGPRSFVGIELKAINPKLSLLEKDIDRLIEIMEETDPAGSNSVQYCVVAYLQRLDDPSKIYYKDHYEKLLARHTNKLDKLFRKIETAFTLEYHTKLITHNPAENMIEQMDELDTVTSDQVASGSGVVVSVVISISR